VIFYLCDGCFILNFCLLFVIIYEFLRWGVVVFFFMYVVEL